MGTAPDPTLDHQPGGHRLLRLIWFLFVAFLIYALSVGPVMKLAIPANMFPPTPIITLYAPLDALYRHIPPVAKFYDWYLKDIWHVK